MKIYFVEDEKSLSEIIKKYVLAEGFDVTCFYDGESAIRHIYDEVDLWILDIMLPGDISGYDIIKQIRKHNPAMPVIFTSARNQSLDKIIGLELGSDDYVSKPYSPKELLLRIKAILRRKLDDKNGIIKKDGYLINLTKREVEFQNKVVELTGKEFDLLELFLNNQNKAFTRDEILDKVWGINYFGSDRAVDDLLRRLRGKMPNLSFKTIYGFGYMLT